MHLDSAPLVVRADRFNPDGRWVDLSVPVGAARAVEIVRRNHSDDVVGPVGEPRKTMTP
jgi:hypothetical protein